MGIVKKCFTHMYDKSDCMQLEQCGGNSNC